MKKKPELRTKSFIVSDAQAEVDIKMAAYDLWGTAAHVLMLFKQKIIAKRAAAEIARALLDIDEAMRHGTYSINPELGAQLTLEAEILKRAGTAGHGVHTGRSRNDQVSTAEMLYMRNRALSTLARVIEVIRLLIALSRQKRDTVMPGYTHMQPGKATTVGQWALSYAKGLLRAASMLQYQLDRFDACPLGACESYGTSWPIDRAYAANLLGFSRVWELPQDAISSRGMTLLGYLYGIQDVGLVASKLAQDLMLFTTWEFGYVELGDEVAQRMHPITGSSVMAQKRNPDVLELIRATAPQLSGFASIVANLLASLPMGYNRDSRETKEYIELGFSKCEAMLAALSEVLSTIRFDEKRLRAAVEDNYSLTTDLADCISQKTGIGYRLVYKVVGQVVEEAMRDGIRLQSITAHMLTNKAKTLGVELAVTDTDIRDALDLGKIIERRKHAGGSASLRMKEAHAKILKEVMPIERYITVRRNVADTARKKTFAALRTLAANI